MKHLKHSLDLIFMSVLKNSDNVMREKKFLVSMSDLDLSENLPEYNGNSGMLQGIADCIFHEPDDMLLLIIKLTDLMICHSSWAIKHSLHCIKHRLR